MNHIDEYRKRREVRLKKRMDEEWVTMRGTHVLIDDDGQVSKGPEAVKEAVKSGGGYEKNKEGRWEKKSGDVPHKPATTIPSMKRMTEYEKEDKTIKDRPKSPIKPNFKRCNKVVDDVFSKMGAEFWEKSTPDTDVWEFPNKVSAKKAATALVNSLREKGYDAVFTTASGMWSEKPTGFIWVKNPKNDYHGVQYSIYKSSDEPVVGKTHLSIDKIETF